MKNIEAIEKNVCAKYIALEEAFKFLKHYLPTQGPLKSFVHHNPLHAFESHKFHEALPAASQLYKARVYLEEETYLHYLKSGLITWENILTSISRHNQINKTSLILEAMSEQDLMESYFMKKLENFNETEQRKIGIYLKKRFFQIQQQIDFEPFCNFENNLFRRVDYHTFLKAKTNIDLNEWVLFYLDKMLASYFDLGIAYWPIQYKDSMLKTFSYVYGKSEFLSKPWKKAFQQELALISNQNLDTTIIGLLDELKIQTDDYKAYLFDLCFRQKGWCALVLDLEKYPHKLTHKCEIKPNFKELVALKILLEKHLVFHFYKREKLPLKPKHYKSDSLAQFRRQILRSASAMLSGNIDLDQLKTISDKDMKRLFSFAATFEVKTKLAIWQEALERKYELEITNAIAQNVSPAESIKAKSIKNIHTNSPRFQMITCIDEREESFRRHVEEVCPDCETLGYAGNFDLNISYKGLYDIHSTNLGNPSLAPTLLLEEKATQKKPKMHLRSLLFQIFSSTEAALLRRPKDFIFGWISSLFAGFILLPYIVIKIFLPETELKLSNKLYELFRKTFQTELILKYVDQNQSSLVELANTVAGVLKRAGLVEGFAPLVFVVGHGSHSLNNPHEAAHDCGACGGGRGGPNARLFVKLINSKIIRKTLIPYGIKIPEETKFIGAFHDTCSDDFITYDLELNSSSTSNHIQSVLKQVSVACKNNAKERTRKFKDVPLNISPKKAYKHVQGRANNLAEPRPEYGHATNLYCILGRRQITRGLLLDRRAFLASYDYTLDTTGDILHSLLKAVTPVVAGINLEYYFGFIDNENFGSGTKLPHNIVALQGVMNGTDSDLLLGLPWQMVEIHEPSRLILVIEAQLNHVLKCLQSRNENFSTLIVNQWIKTIVLDPVQDTFFEWDGTRFVQISNCASHSLPVNPSSLFSSSSTRNPLPISKITAKEVPN